MIHLRLRLHEKVALLRSLFWPRPDYVPRRGRPLRKDRDKTLAATKPWEALEISERTYYRRKAEGKL